MKTKKEKIRDAWTMIHVKKMSLEAVSEELGISPNVVFLYLDLHNLHPEYWKYLDYEESDPLHISLEWARELSHKRPDEQVAEFKRRRVSRPVRSRGVMHLLKKKTGILTFAKPVVRLPKPEPLDKAKKVSDQLEKDGRFRRRG